MYAFLILSLCFFVALHEAGANKILGRFDTTSSSLSASTTTVDGHTGSSSSSSSVKEYTSWEVLKDKTCVKRVVQEDNGVTVQDSVTPIDCARARQEVRAMKDRVRVELSDKLINLKVQQEQVIKQHAIFLKNTEAELNAVKDFLKVVNGI